MEYKPKGHKFYESWETKLRMKGVSTFLTEHILQSGPYTVLQQMEGSQFDFDYCTDILTIYSDSKKMYVEIDIGRRAIMDVEEACQYQTTEDDDWFYFQKRFPDLPSKLVINDVDVNPSIEIVTLQFDRPVNTETHTFKHLLVHSVNKMGGITPATTIHSNASIDQILNDSNECILSISYYEKETKEILQLWSRGHGYLY